VPPSRCQPSWTLPWTFVPTSSSACEVVRVELPEPRDKFSPEFTRYESEITRVLKEEVDKARER
jgi:hypothetical protein